jgi:hypothetical protein
VAKRAAKRKPARKRPDALTIAVALERARLKRLVVAKRDIARLANELSRVTARTRGKLVELAREIAADHGLALGDPPEQQFHP